MEMASMAEELLELALNWYFGQAESQMTCLLWLCVPDTSDTLLPIHLKYINSLKQKTDTAQGEDLGVKYKYRPMDWRDDGADY